MQTLDQRYQLKEVIDEGGMATVYHAWDSALERTVAIKLLRLLVPLTDQEAQHFLREAQFAAQLAHPNIVTVHDAGTHEGQPFVVMELLGGASLRKRLRGSPLPLEKALSVALAVAGALQVAHKASILHLDVKPENILFGEQGESKLSDFGISRMVSDPRTQTIVGTAAYMAPEQLTGAGLDARTDLYALGVVLYEMLTGQTPFVGEHALAQATQRLLSDPPPACQVNPAISVGLSELVGRALARDPAARFSSVAEFAAALRAYEQQATQPTTAISMPPSVQAPIASAAVPPPEPEPHLAEEGTPRHTTTHTLPTGWQMAVGAFALGSFLTLLCLLALFRPEMPGAASPPMGTQPTLSGSVLPSVPAPPLGIDDSKPLPPPLEP